MGKRILITAFAVALTIGLMASPADARLISDGGSSYAFQSIDSSFDITLVLTNVGNVPDDVQEEGECFGLKAGGDEHDTPSGICYDPIEIGGSGN